MNPIDLVRGRLDGGRLWQKGEIGEYDLLDMPVCLMGACHYASRSDLRVGDIAGPLAQVIAEQYPERVDYNDTTVEWFNDHPLTTWDDVDMVLDKTSAWWDETNGAQS